MFTNNLLRNRNLQIASATITLVVLSSILLLTLSMTDDSYFHDRIFTINFPVDLPSSLLVLSLVLYFLSGVVKGVAGIGMGLVAVPSIGVLYNPVLAICLIAVPLVVTNFWQGIIRGKLSHTLSHFRVLIVSMTIVMVFTAYFSPSFPTAVLTLTLGVIAIAFSLLNLGVKLPRIPDSLDFRLQLACGVVAGFVGGLTGLVVIPLVFYMICRRVSKEIFVPVLGLLFLISGVVLLFCYGLNGAMTPELLLLSTMAAVPALLGVLTGEKIRQNINAQLFRKIVLYLIMLIGVKLVFF